MIFVADASHPVIGEQNAATGGDRDENGVFRPGCLQIVNRGEAQQAYPEKGVRGYPVAMSFNVGETLLSPQMLLWLAASGAAALLLFGSINRRRSRLTDSLRGYVGKKQKGRHDSRPDKDESSETE